MLTYLQRIFFSESADIAFTYARLFLNQEGGNKAKWFDDKELYFHIPDGATPKVCISVSPPALSILTSDTMYVYRMAQVLVLPSSLLSCRWL